MTFFHASILSIIEGITEFLPISSTGHMLLASELLQIPSSPFLFSFIIAIQLGAIFAVVVFFAKKLLAGLDIWKKIVVASLPTACIGFFFYAFIKHFLENEKLLLGGIFFGGIGMILVEMWLKNPLRLWRLRSGAGQALFLEKGEEKSNTGSSFFLKRGLEGGSDIITYKQAFFIGLFQSIAFIPGVSRSAASIIGGLLLGISRKTIVEFSFLLAIPTMVAATGLDLLKTSVIFTKQEWFLLMFGIVSSFLVAWLAIKWFLKFIEKYTFIPFGIYRVVMALVMAGIWFI